MSGTYWISYMKRYPVLIGFIVIILFFFKPFMFNGKLPIPSDTIIGLYHPFRDLYAKNYPNGIPFKNFLITDPVRQQYPWRYLSISLEKKLELPLWNPYSFSGTPHLANFQSGSLYPLNALYFLLPFNLAWSVLIVLQPFLAGLFLYLYLRYMRINRVSSLLGALTFSFSGFSIAWMEWNTVLHVALWLPLLLLAKEHLLRVLSVRWIIVFLIAECFAIFAGHLQTYFYFFIVSNAYLLARLIQLSDKQRKERLEWLVRRYIPFILLGIIVFVITFIQTAPTIQFIGQSARNIDQSDWTKEGWFIPFQHLIQFIAPDFFGNPTTLNYWGVWNYGELVGYVGVIPLLLALFALFFRRDKKTLFFGTLFFVSLLFSLPTPLAKLPFILKIPFLSTAQPTRLLFVTDFSLAILAAFGLDHFIRADKKKIVYPLTFLMIIFMGLWMFVLLNKNTVLLENLLVAKRNLIFPSIIFFISFLLIVGALFLKNKKYSHLFVGVLIVITVFDLLHFGEKFTPFTNREYLFPSTKTIEFLQKNVGNYRIMSTDSRILPPNFSIIYRLQSIEGYDPLYLQRYAELIAASERGKPNIDPPFGFNRIITPHNYDSKIIDLLGVKYVLSLSDLNSPKLKKVFQEGQTRVYENKNVLPRTFFADSTYFAKNKQEAINILFRENFNIRRSFVVEDKHPAIKHGPVDWNIGQADIVKYEENKIIIDTQNDGYGFLVFTDSFYPTWKAKIDNIKTEVYRTDYNFRGIFVPRGNHTIEFYDILF